MGGTYPSALDGCGWLGEEHRPFLGLLEGFPGVLGVLVVVHWERWVGGWVVEFTLFLPLCAGKVEGIE